MRAALTRAKKSILCFPAKTCQSRVGPGSETTGQDTEYTQIVDPSFISCKRSPLGRTPAPSKKITRSLFDKGVYQALS